MKIKVVSSVDPFDKNYPAIFHLTPVAPPTSREPSIQFCMISVDSKFPLVTT